MADAAPLKPWYLGVGGERPTHMKEGAGDVWSAAIKPHPVASGLPQVMLLVEDSSMRRQMEAPSTVNRVPTVRLMLLDRYKFSQFINRNKRCQIELYIASRSSPRRSRRATWWGRAGPMHALLLKSFS